MMTKNGITRIIINNFEDCLKSLNTNKTEKHLREIERCINIGLENFKDDAEFIFLNSRLTMIRKYLFKNLNRNVGLKKIGVV